MILTEDWMYYNHASSMCGRYTLTAPAGTLVEELHIPEEDIEELETELHPRFNIGPGQHVPVIVMHDGQRHAKLMRWGYLPVWAKNLNDGYKYINARSEGVFDKRTWRNAILHRRCLIPSDGFYEWRKREDGVKQPYRIYPKQQPFYCFAGVWSTWKDAEGLPWDTFAILTTEANAEMQPIHDRMPVILQPDDYDRWLDTSLDEPDAIAGLLHPLPDNSLEIYPVSPKVNTTRSDDESLILPINSK